MSQTLQILKQLEKGHPLTALDALKYYGCLRLAARILDIEHMGYIVLRRDVTVNNKRVTEYMGVRKLKNVPA
jgi:hypothetical protein